MKKIKLPTEKGTFEYSGKIYKGKSLGLRVNNKDFLIVGETNEDLEMIYDKLTYLGQTLNKNQIKDCFVGNIDKLIKKQEVF